MTGEPQPTDAWAVVAPSGLIVATSVRGSARAAQHAVVKWHGHHWGLLEAIGYRAIPVTVAPRGTAPWPTSTVAKR